MQHVDMLACLTLRYGGALQVLRGGYLKAGESCPIVGIRPCSALMEEQMLWDTENARCTARSPVSVIQGKK